MWGLFGLRVLRSGWLLWDTRWRMSSSRWWPLWRCNCLLLLAVWSSSRTFSISRGSGSLCWLFLMSAITPWFPASICFLPRLWCWLIWLLIWCMFFLIRGFVMIELFLVDFGGGIGVLGVFVVKCCRFAGSFFWWFLKE